jgi:hypothetical protein
MKKEGFIKMVEKKTWEEFRKQGFLWWINMILHTFGWAIVVEVEDDGSISAAYPARVKFRGFGVKDNEKGYIAVSEYMKDTAEQLHQESCE